MDKLADESRDIKLREKIEGFTLFDDELMSRVFDENIECTELVLSILLKRTDIRVKQSQSCFNRGLSIVHYWFI